jgi:hypothetical protein
MGQLVLSVNWGRGSAVLSVPTAVESPFSASIGHWTGRPCLCRPQSIRADLAAATHTPAQSPRSRDIQPRHCPSDSRHRSLGSDEMGRKHGHAEHCSESAALRPRVEPRAAAETFSGAKTPPRVPLARTNKAALRALLGVVVATTAPPVPVRLVRAAISSV